ncbi:MAG: hypothetical protein LBF94_02380 [Puniceicoccales bacterium]|nr:hypothetical protein [Puniceicoccales bacterium]
MTERLLGSTTNLPSLQSVESNETGIRHTLLSDTNFKLISAPQGGRVLNDKSISNSELVSFRSYIGLGISRNNCPSSYKQILPERIFVKADETLSLLDSNEKTYFTVLLNDFDGKNPKSPSDFLAISTLFSVLAYGSDFAKYFMKNANEGCFFLHKSQEFLEAEHIFKQNYLNTCGAVSAFTAISDAFCGNTEILNLVLKFELAKAENFTNDSLKDQPAYKSHSWRKAPTVGEERKRRIKQCQNAINKKAELLLPAVETKKSIGERQDILLKAFERMSAIYDTNCKPGLLSKRVYSNFWLASILNLLGNILAKIASLGLYVSSFDLEERLEAEITIPKIGLLSRDTWNSVPFFEREPFNNVWQRAFNNGISQEARDLKVFEHFVAVKAAIDENGQKFLIVYDPLKKAPEIITV